MRKLLIMTCAAAGFGVGFGGGIALLGQASAEPLVRLFNPTPPLTPCATPTRGGALTRALARGFGVQYWGDGYSAADLAKAPHGLLIVEASKVGALHTADGREQLFTKDEVAMISRDGTRPVIAYLNVAEIEDYRDYWVNSQSTDPRNWFGPRTAHDERLATYWTPEWEAILLERVDRLMALGFNGLFLDDVLHYYSFGTGTGLDWPDGMPVDGPQSAPGHARAMMALVQKISARAKESPCGAIIVVNNGAYIGRDAGPDSDDKAAQARFASYLGSIDAILMENIFGSATEAQTVQALQEDYQHRGVKVLSLDYTSHFQDEGTARLQDDITARAAKVGFVPYVAQNEAFDRLYPPSSELMPDQALQ
ncbi:endo alpha-1,4 polygalactosaminidase [Pseudogemmobacter sp. W21_MBD1_M6]|uniref:endo alpha-1,4 polygalactosaminidase n=1 Tax=Pseudogemmobacter sp. W21_MBD1_M6 TaxID=3240271 RepID=UPI003F9727BF